MFYRIHRDRSILRRSKDKDLFLRTRSVAKAFVFRQHLPQNILHLNTSLAYLLRHCY